MSRKGANLQKSKDSIAYVTRVYSLALSSKGSFEDVSESAAFKSGPRASSRSSISSSSCSKRERTFEESIIVVDLCVKGEEEEEEEERKGK